MIINKPVNNIKSKVHPHGELFLFIKYQSRDRKELKIKKL